jgi:hypothetical protein
MSDSDLLKHRYGIAFLPSQREDDDAFLSARAESRNALVRIVHELSEDERYEAVSTVSRFVEELTSHIGYGTRGEELEIVLEERFLHDLSFVREVQRCWPFFDFVEEYVLIDYGVQADFIHNHPNAIGYRDDVLQGRTPTLRTDDHDDDDEENDGDGQISRSRLRSTTSTSEKKWWTKKWIWTTIVLGAIMLALLYYFFPDFQSR